MRWVALGVIVALSAPAYADDVKSADEKFEAARKLDEQGKPAEACALFAESLALNPNAIGTILNVGLCAEKASKVATAIHYFSDARDRAREQNLAPQLAAAEQHLASLEPRAPHLAIAFAEAYPRDAKLVIDDRVIDFASASDVLVDPGKVRVVLSAPGRVPYTTTLDIAEAQHEAISIPKLGYPVTVCKVCRPVGVALVGVGAAAVVTSVIVGWLAHSHWQDATANCVKDASGTPVCAQQDFDKANSAISLGNAGTAIGIAGGVLAVGGAVLWYFSPRREEDPPRGVAIVPVVSPEQAGLAAVGHF